MGSRPKLLASSSGMALGGSTTFLLNLGRAMRERGTPLSIACLMGGNGMARDFAAAGVPVEDFPGEESIFEDRIRLGYQYAAQLRPNAVLSCLGSDCFELLPLSPPGVARIGLVQSDDPGVYRMVRHFAPFMDGIVGVSETICQRLREDAAFKKVRVEYIPYGIHFGPVTARLPRDPTAPLKIIYLGRIVEEQKRVSRLVELARILTARGEHFEFTLGGTGPAFGEVGEALKAMPSVRLAGDVPNLEIAALLGKQDVFVLLSDYEGLPLSLLEAMGQGVVPVISDLESGIRNVVTPDIGIRAPVGDVAAAADAIGALARDPVRLRAMSAAAVLKARGEFSSLRMAERYENLVAALASPVAPEWPAMGEVPPPVLVPRPWMFRGFPRHARRFVKRLRRLGRS